LEVTWQSAVYLDTVASVASSGTPAWPFGTQFFKTMARWFTSEQNSSIFVPDCQFLASAVASVASGPLSVF
jgi:hypothetical protein